MSSRPRSSWIAALAAILLGACGEPPASAPVQAAIVPRKVVEQRLETKLEADPNRALCDELAHDLAGGNRDALRARFDLPSFVERVVANGSLPSGLVERLRADPAGPSKFGRAEYPDGSKFLCLGTRPFLGEPYLAIRQWIPTRYDYLLIHLTGRSEHPIDDYHVVSEGFLHSELQAVGLDPKFRVPVTTLNAMFQQSFDEDFAGIIKAYRTLPRDVQALPLAFFHFINAVYQSERPDSPLYREATLQLEDVLRGREYALAYWHREDALRRGDAALELRARGRLLDLLDDYELLAR